MRTLVVILVLALAGCVTTGGNTVDNTKMAEGYYMKGLAFFQENKYELAAVEFHRSIQTDSSNKWSYYYLGIISDSREKFDDAVGFYKEAINADSNFSEAYNAIGTTYSRQQKWQEALKAYNKALDNKLYTTPHLPYYNIGQVYMAQKDYEKAIEAFRDAKRNANLDFIINALGTALFESGKTKEAINEFSEGVKVAPKSAGMRYNLALAYLKAGRKNLALSEFKKAAEFAPQSDIAAKANDYIKTLR